MVSGEIPGQGNGLPPADPRHETHASSQGSWSDEWARMEKMEPGEAMERFNELAAGRKLPGGFKGWPKAQRVEWLDREWALGGGVA